jgi:hypothetical protein
LSVYTTTVRSPIAASSRQNLVVVHIHVFMSRTYTRLGTHAPAAVQTRREWVFVHETIAFCRRRLQHPRHTRRVHEKFSLSIDGEWRTEVHEHAIDRKHTSMSACTRSILTSINIFFCRASPQATIRSRKHGRASAYALHAVCAHMYSTRPTCTC